MKNKIRDRLGQSMATVDGAVGAPQPEKTAKQKSGVMESPAIETDIEDDHEAKDHLNTLMKAESIKKNKVKMEKVHALAGRHTKQIKSIQDLKDTFDKKFGRGALKKPKV